MAVKEIRAGRAAVEIVARDRVKAGLDKVGKRFMAFGRGMATVGAGLVTAGTALLTPMVAAAKIFSDVGDQLDKMSARTGMTVEALSTLGFAAATSGATLENVAGGARGMSKFMYELQRGSAAAEEAAGDLGLKLSDLEGLTQEERFKLFADRIAGVGDPATRAALAMKVFGRSGEALLPLLREGAAGIEALQQKARNLNLEISSDDSKKAAELNDRVGELWSQFKSLAFHVGAALAPSLIALVEAIQPVLAGVIQWVKDNRALIATVAKVAVLVIGVGSALLAVGTTVGLIGFAMTGLVAAFGFLVAAVKIALIVIGGLAMFFLTVVAPIAAVVAALLYFTGTTGKVVSFIRTQFANLKEYLATVFGGIKDALLAGDLALAGKVALLALQVALLNGVAALSSLVGGMFGDFLGTLGTQIAGGDFAGAWSTAVAGMAMVWDSFVEGIVAVFTTTARVLVDAWQRVSKVISDTLLEASANGSMLGKLLGIDLSAEQKRADENDQRKRELAQSNIDRFTALLADAEANGGVTRDASDDNTEYTADELRRLIADQQAVLGSARTNVLGDAKAIADQQVSGTADAVRARLDAMDRDAQHNARDSKAAFKGQVGGGVNAAREAAIQAQKDLEAARAEAARKLEEKRNAPATPTFDQEGTTERLGGVGKGSSLGTFSAAAAVRLGAGLGPQERIANGVEQMVEEQRLTRKDIHKIRPRTL